MMHIPHHVGHHGDKSCDRTQQDGARKGAEHKMMVGEQGWRNKRFTRTADMLGKPYYDKDTGCEVKPMVRSRK